MPTLAGTVLAGSPADFGKLIADETEKWGKVMRATHQGGVIRTQTFHNFPFGEAQSLTRAAEVIKYSGGI